MASRHTRRGELPPADLDRSMVGIDDDDLYDETLRVASWIVVERAEWFVGRIQIVLRRYAWTAVGTRPKPDPTIPLDQVGVWRSRALRALGMTMSELRNTYREEGVLPLLVLCHFFDYRLLRVLATLIADGPGVATQGLEKALELTGEEEIEVGRGRRDNNRTDATQQNYLSAVNVLRQRLVDMRTDRDVDPVMDYTGALRRWTTPGRTIKLKMRGSRRDRLTIPTAALIASFAWYERDINLRLAKRFGTGTTIDNVDLDALAAQPQTWYATSGLFGRLQVVAAASLLLVVRRAQAGSVDGGVDGIPDEARLVAGLRYGDYRQTAAFEMPGLEDEPQPMGRVGVDAQKGASEQARILAFKWNRRIAVLAAFVHGAIGREQFHDEPLIPRSYVPDKKSGRLPAWKPSSITSRFTGNDLGRRQSRTLPAVAAFPQDPSVIGLSGRAVTILGLERIGVDANAYFELEDRPEDPDEAALRKAVCEKGFEALDDARLHQLAVAKLEPGWDLWRGCAPHGLRRCADRLLADHTKNWLDLHPDVPGRYIMVAIKEGTLGHLEISSDPLDYGGTASEEEERERLTCCGSHVLQEVVFGDLARPRGADVAAITLETLAIRGIRPRLRTAQRERRRLEQLLDANRPTELVGRDEYPELIRPLLERVAARELSIEEATAEADALWRRTAMHYDQRVVDAERRRPIVASEAERLDTLLKEQINKARELCDRRNWIPLADGEKRADVQALLLAIEEDSGPRYLLVRDFLLGSELIDFTSWSKASFNRHLDPHHAPNGRERRWRGATPVVYLDEARRVAIFWVPALLEKWFRTDDEREELLARLSAWPEGSAWQPGGRLRRQLPVVLAPGVWPANTLLPAEGPHVQCIRAS